MNALDGTDVEFPCVSVEFGEVPATMDMSRALGRRPIRGHKTRSPRVTENLRRRGEDVPELLQELTHM